MKFLFLLLFSGTAFGKPIQLALNWKAEPQFGGFYAAEDKFKAAGIEVQIQQGGSGTPTLQMLLSGKVDYAVVSADEVVMAHDRGNKNIVALFAAYQKNPQAIMTRDTHPARTLSELLQSEGRLLWQEGLPYAQYLKRKYGPLKIKTSPYSGGLANFIADEKISQQCFATSEPLLARKQGINVKTFLVADSGYNPYTTVLATTHERLKKDPEQVKKIVRAVREGWQDYLKDPEKTHVKINKLNPAMDIISLKSSAEAQKDLIATLETQQKGLGIMSFDRWQTLVTQLNELKIIKTKPDPATMFSN